MEKRRRFRRPEIEELRAFVGPNANSYLRRWGVRPRDVATPLRLNVAAGLFGVQWLILRKLYLPATLFVGFVAVLIQLQEIFASWLPGTWGAAVSQMVRWLLQTIPLAIFGNRLYLHHAQRQIAAIKASSPTGEGGILRAIERRGGRGWPSVLLTNAMLVAAAIWISERS